MILWGEETTDEAATCPECGGSGIVTSLRDWFVPRVCPACNGVELDPDTREKLETLL